MKENLGKGTDIFKFMGDYFKLMSNFWFAESKESYWSQLMQSSDAMLEEYKNCDFYQFARGLILILNIYLSDVKYKGIKNGHWTISYKED